MKHSINSYQKVQEELEAMPKKRIWYELYSSKSNLLRNNRFLPPNTRIGCPGNTRIVGMPYPRRLAADMEPRRHGANLAFHRYRNAFRSILNRKSHLPITGSGFFVSSIYFSRINILIGVPVKSQFSILFSRKRLYGPDPLRQVTEHERRHAARRKLGDIFDLDILTLP